jgi:hypothetical protein
VNWLIVFGAGQFSPHAIVGHIGGKQPTLVGPRKVVAQAIHDRHRLGQTGHVSTLVDLADQAFSRVGQVAVGVATPVALKLLTLAGAGKEVKPTGVDQSVLELPYRAFARVHMSHHAIASQDKRVLLGSGSKDLPIAFSGKPIDLTVEHQLALLAAGEPLLMVTESHGAEAAQGHWQFQML